MQEVNHLGDINEDKDSFEPFLSESRINEKEVIILRDLGSTFDVMAWKLVNKNQLVNQYTWLKQTFDKYPKCFRVAHMEVEIKGLGCVSTKVAILNSKSNTKHYSLENKMQALINEKQKQNTETDASGNKSDSNSVGGTQFEINQTLTNLEIEKKKYLFSPSRKNNHFQLPGNKERCWKQSLKVIKSEIDRCGNSKGRHANFEYVKYERTWKSMKDDGTMTPEVIASKRDKIKNFQSKVSLEGINRFAKIFLNSVEKCLKGNADRKGISHLWDNLFKDVEQLCKKYCSSNLRRAI